MCYSSLLHNILINIPGVARAVLQTPLLLIQSISQSVLLFLQTFKTLLHPNRKSSGAEIWDNVHPPPFVICHVSRVRCHVSCVTYNVEGLLSMGPTSFSFWRIRAWVEIRFRSLNPLLNVIWKLFYTKTKQIVMWQNSAYVVSLESWSITVGYIYILLFAGPKRGRPTPGF